MNDPNLCPIHKIPFKETPYGTKCTKFVGKDSTGKSLFCGLKPQAITQDVPTVAVDPYAGLRGGVDPVAVPGAPTITGSRPVSPVQPPTDWAAKDRLICAQTCLKAACVFYAGTGMRGEMEQLAEGMYRGLMRVQAGGSLEFPDTGNPPF